MLLAIALERGFYSRGCVLNSAVVGSVLLTVIRQTIVDAFSPQIEYGNLCRLARTVAPAVSQVNHPHSYGDECYLL